MSADVSTFLSFRILYLIFMLQQTTAVQFTGRVANPGKIAVSSRAAAVAA